MRREFGQYEPLTVRLRNLIESYPFGIGLAKEFLQNADDAGASLFELCFDERSLEVPGHTMQGVLLGPALVTLNDAVFKDEDFDSIQRIADSGKRRDATKTGRFGVGFNVCYNVTDTPMILSNDRLCVFDPHEHLAKGFESRGPGFQLSLDEVWSEFPTLGTLFEPFGLKPSQPSYEGTVFRLPLRNEERARTSEVHHEPTTAADIDQVLEECLLVAPELLLFLKSVLDIRVSRIRGAERDPATFERSVLGSFGILNGEQVRANRSAILGCVAKGEVLDTLEMADGHALEWPYPLTISATTHETSWTEHWLVVNGLYGGDSGELIEHARTAPPEDKTIPWAGAALCMDSSGRELPREGKLYCFLPIPGSIDLPVHLHGFVALDPSRHVNSFDDPLAGKDARKAQWNSLLVEHGIARAYASLLHEYRDFVGENGADGFYETWPRAHASASHLGKEFAGFVYSRLWNLPVVATLSDERWQCPHSVRTLPKGWLSLQEPLEAEGLGIPSPRLPEWICEAFGATGLKLSQLKPADARTLYSTQHHEPCLPPESSHKSLQRPNWVADILRFCLSDSKGAECKGLPLLLHADGLLRQIGSVRTPTGFCGLIAGSEVREVFAQRPEWFVDEAFAERAALDGSPAAKAAGIAPLSNESLPILIRSMLGDEVDRGVSWDPHSTNPPNEIWLERVILLLASVYVKSFGDGWLSGLPLLPDRRGQLLCLGPAVTPLLPSDNATTELISVLDKLGVPLFGGSECLESAFRILQSAVGGSVSLLTPASLVDTIDRLPTLVDRLTDNDSSLIAAFVLEGLDGLGQASLTKARSLRIYPTACSGPCAPGRDPGYLLPHSLGSFGRLGKNLLEGKVFYRCGPDDSWCSALRKLGVKDLDSSNFIMDVLLPEYQRMEGVMQDDALRYILRHMESEDALEDGRIRVIECTPLVWTEAHELVALNRLYHPDSKAGSILSQGAPVPSTDRYPRAKWERAFRMLDLAVDVRAADLLESIDQLSQLYLAGQDSAGLRLTQTFAYIQDHWDRLANQFVDGKKFAALLSEMCWLPCQIDSDKLAQFTCFLPPTRRLYRPGELAPPNLGHRLAATMPIATFGSPTTEFSKALGITSAQQIDGKALCHQLVCISNASCGKGDLPFHVESAARSTADLYRSLVDWIGDDASKANQLRDWLKGVPCVWDDLQKRMWEPSHCFVQSVNLGRWRFVANSADVKIEALLQRIGKRVSPDTEDYLMVLEEISRSYGVTVLDEEDQSIVCSIWRTIVRSGMEGDPPHGALVIDVSGRMMSVVYENDLPSIYGALDLKNVPIKHSALPSGVEAWNFVRSLRGAISEVVTEVVQCTTSDKSNEVERLSRWVRSEHFQLGLLRLLRSELPLLGPESVTWLESFRIVLCHSIRISVLLATEMAEEHLGDRSPKSFYEESGHVLYLAADLVEDVPICVAEAIEVVLRRQYPFSKGVLLLRMVEIVPERLTKFLDERGIARLPDDSDPMDVDEVSTDVHWPGEQEDETPDRSELDEAPSDDEFRDSKGVPDVGGQDARSDSPGRSGKRSPREPRTGEMNELTAADVQRRSPGDSQEGNLTPNRGGSGALAKERTSHERQERVDRRTRDKLRSYVIGAEDGRAQSTELSEVERHALQVGKAAEEFVFNEEQGHWRSIKKMPHMNEGFDLACSNREDLIGDHVDVVEHAERFIEVKGIDGEWSLDGVGVSAAQMRFAQSQGSRFWLYVVEYAMDKERRRLYRLQNPFEVATEFRFDNGWAVLAAEDDVT